MIEQRQRGALIFATPLLLVLIVTFTTLLIDGSRLLLVRSEMQSIVNSTATAAADEAQTCSGVPATFNAMQTRGLLAAKAAGFDGDEAAIEIVPGVLLQGQSTASPMVFTSRNPNTQMAQTNAAWVKYTRTEPLSALFPESVFPPITLTAEAAARKEVYAILSATGATATVQGGLLGPLVGQLIGAPGYSLDATNLQSLESTLIGVGDLLSALGVADLTSLVDEPLIDVLNAVVGLTGGVTSPVGSIVDDLTNAVGLSGLNASAVFEVIGQPPGNIQASFPVYDFVISVVLNSAKALNQSTSSLLSLGLDTAQSPLLSGLVQSINLLGDVDVTLNLVVDEPPRIVIGPARQNEQGEWLTTVRASDIALETALDIQLATGILGDLISTLSLGLIQISILDNISIPLAVQVGGGEATLVNAKCARGGLNEAEFDFLMQDSVASVKSGRVDAGTGQVTPEPIGVKPLLGLELLGVSVANVCVEADLDINLASTSANQVLESYNLYCPAGECDIEPVDSGNNALQGLDIQVRNLDLSCGQGGLTGVVSTVLSGLVTPLTGLLKGVTEPVLGQLVAPLLSALGADLGGMQLRVLGAEQTGSQLVERAVFE